MVIAIVVLSIVLGLFRGMVKEILSLLNWVLSFWIANRYGASLSVYMDWADSLSPQIKVLIGFVVAFFAAMLVGSILISLLVKVISAAGLSFIDRTLGGTFGFFRGLFIVLVLVTGAGFTSLPEQPFWQKAMLSPLAVDAIREIKPHLPGSVAKWVRY
jgi:membrane protein required for colicin V production